MSGLSSAADLVQLGPLNSQQLVKGYNALSQPHVDRLCSNFARWYFMAAGKLRNCENPLRVEYKMVAAAEIFNIRTPISLQQLKLETLNLVHRL